MTTIGKAERGFRRAMLVMAGFSLATNLLLLVVPVYMLQVYDRVLPARSTETLLFLSLIALAALGLLAGLETVRSVIANRVANRLDTDLSDLALRTVIRQGAASGGSTQPLRDIDTIRGLLSSKAIFILLDLPFGVIFLAVLYLIHPDLFWLTVAGAVLLLGLAAGNQVMLAREARRDGDLSLGVSARADHLARSADSLLAMGMVANVVNGWGHMRARSLQSGDRAAGINAWFAGASKFLRLLLQVAILGYGAHLVLIDEMTAGMIFAASLISGRALQPIDQIIGVWRQLGSGTQAWRRLQTFMARADQRPQYTELPVPNGHVEVEDLLQPNPADPARQPILQRLSFRLEAGRSVAVLGPSGSGKSTLARMLVGAMRPRAGHVRIDGHDIANWDPEHLGRHVGYVAQEVDLVPGTIAQNIARFDPAAADAAIVAAARAAHAEELIARLPMGYDTQIGTGGVQLSGGEKQRIALARAFYGDVRLLVLDEPNSNLDRVGEIALMRALEEARRRSITVFVITQREMVLAAVDRIMRIQNGQILDYDEREQVLAKFRAGDPSAGGRPAQPPQPSGPIHTVQAGGRRGHVGGLAS